MNAEKAPQEKINATKGATDNMVSDQPVSFWQKVVLFNQKLKHFLSFHDNRLARDKTKHAKKPPREKGLNGFFGALKANIIAFFTRGIPSIGYYGLLSLILIGKFIFIIIYYLLSFCLYFPLGMIVAWILTNVFLSATQKNVERRKKLTADFNSFEFSQLVWEENEQKYPTSQLKKIAFPLDKLAKSGTKVTIPSQMNPTEPESTSMDLSGLVFTKEGNKRWAVLCHGWTENKYEMMHLVNMYFAQNYNVLVYDARFHGESEGEYTTIGFLEKHDLYFVVKWLINNHKVQNIILHGQSMGGATIIEYLKIAPPRHRDLIETSVVDGAFNRLHTQEAHVLSQRTKIFPSYYFLMFLIWGINHRYQYSCVVEAPLRNIHLVVDIPILFIHSSFDKMVLVKNSERFYFKLKSINLEAPVKFYHTNKGTHCDLYFADPKTYQTNVFDWINYVRTMELKHS